MGREIIGLVDCPECGLSGAQIKLQKSGLAYRFCPDCAAQFFPRSEAESKRLLSKIPVTGTGAAAVVEPVTEAKPAAKKSGFNLGAL